MIKMVDQKWTIKGGSLWVGGILRWPGIPVKDWNKSLIAVCGCMNTCFSQRKERSGRGERERKRGREEERKKERERERDWLGDRGQKRFQSKLRFTHLCGNTVQSGYAVHTFVAFICECACVCVKENEREREREKANVSFFPTSWTPQFIWMATGPKINVTHTHTLFSLFIQNTHTYTHARTDMSGGKERTFKSCTRNGIKLVAEVKNKITWTNEKKAKKVTQKN